MKEIATKDPNELLQTVLRDREVALARARNAEEELQRCQEALLRLKGQLRVVARARPPTEEASADGDEGQWLQILGPQQLKVTTKKQNRRMRMSTGGIRDAVSPDRRPPSSLGRHQAMQMDCVLGPEDSGDRLYQVLQPDVAAGLEGEAVCILAYGASRSGKTFTMDWVSDQVASELEIRAKAERSSGLARTEVALQVFALHGDQTEDLLLEAGTSVPSVAPPLPKLSLGGGAAAAAAAGVAVWKSCSPEDCSGQVAESLGKWLSQARARREQLAASVSRFHVITTFQMTCTDLSGDAQRVGRLSLVDLAASDRRLPSGTSSTSCEGPARHEQIPQPQAAKEARSALRALGALADCIQARESGCSHVPYKSSKLTHLLQEPLGGCQDRCRTVLLLTLDPSAKAQQEGLRTLQFGTRLLSSSVARARGTGPRRQLALALEADASSAEESADDDDLRACSEQLQSSVAKVEAQLKEYQLQLEAKEKEIQEVREDSKARESLKMLIGCVSTLPKKVDDMLDYQLAGSSLVSTAASMSSLLPAPPAAEATSSFRAGKRVVRAVSADQQPLAAGRVQVALLTSSSSTSAGLDAHRVRPVLRNGTTQGSCATARPGSPPPQQQQDRQPVSSAPGPCSPTAAGLSPGPRPVASAPGPRSPAGNRRLAPRAGGAQQSLSPSAGRRGFAGASQAPPGSAQRGRSRGEALSNVAQQRLTAREQRQAPAQAGSDRLRSARTRSPEAGRQATTGPKQQQPSLAAAAAAQSVQRRAAVPGAPSALALRAQQRRDHTGALRKAQAADDVQPQQAQARLRPRQGLQPLQQQQQIRPAGSQTAPRTAAAPTSAAASRLLAWGSSPGRRQHQQQQQRQRAMGLRLGLGPQRGLQEAGAASGLTKAAGSRALHKTPVPTLLLAAAAGHSAAAEGVTFRPRQAPLLGEQLCGDVTGMEVADAGLRSPSSCSSSSSSGSSSSSSSGLQQPTVPRGSVPRDLLPLKLDLSSVLRGGGGGGCGATTARRPSLGGGVPSTPRGRPPVVWYAAPRHDEEAPVAPASARGHAPASAAKAGSRRRQISREYIVEVLSPRTAMTLAEEGAQGPHARKAAPAPISTEPDCLGEAADSVQSPLLLLRPPLLLGTDRGEAGAGGGSRSLVQDVEQTAGCSSSGSSSVGSSSPKSNASMVSESSDEDQIRSRLLLGLREEAGRTEKQQQPGSSSCARPPPTQEEAEGQKQPQEEECRRLHEDLCARLSPTASSGNAFESQACTSEQAHHTAAKHSVPQLLLHTSLPTPSRSRRGSEKLNGTE